MGSSTGGLQPDQNQGCAWREVTEGAEGTQWHQPQPCPTLGCRSNLMGTRFTVFDNGANPDRANADWSNVRQELSAVVYVRAAPQEPLPTSPGQGERGSHPAPLHWGLQMCGMGWSHP